MDKVTHLPLEEFPFYGHRVFVGIKNLLKPLFLYVVYGHGNDQPLASLLLGKGSYLEKYV